MPPKIEKYLRSMGFKPKREVDPSCSWSNYCHPETGDSTSVYRLGREYKGWYIKVYTNNAIRTSDYKSTRITDMIAWLENNINY
jgi:hypothetical protein